MELYNLLNTYAGECGLEQLRGNLKKLGLGHFVNKDLNLMLVKYDRKKKTNTDFNNVIVRYSRGLIIDTNTLLPVCIPPEKSLPFMSFQNIVDNWKNVIVEEFLDGTMINAFNHNGEWHISTRSYIGANCRWYSEKRFDEMFGEALGSLKLENLNPGLCYTFVLMHPDNRIVTKYEKASLCLVQARELRNEGFVDIDLNYIVESLKPLGIDIRIPRKYKIERGEDINSILENMSFEEQGLIFKYNGFRSKLRNQKFENAKFVRGNNKNSFFTYISLRQSNRVKQFLSYFPEYNDEFNNHRLKIQNYTKLLYQNYANSYISKTQEKSEIPFELRPLCYNLHGIYLKDKQKVTLRTVIQFFNDLPPAKMIFVINYQENKARQDSLELVEGAKTSNETIMVEESELVENEVVNRESISEVSETLGNMEVEVAS